MMDESLGWLILHLTPGLGPQTSRRLVEHFGGVDHLLAVRPADLHANPVVRTLLRAQMPSSWPQREAERELERVATLGGRVIAWGNEDYPDLLREIHAPPLVLYARGRLECLQAPKIAVVGSRAASEYGRQAARKFAHDLACAGLVIVSGMAAGIDAAAHAGALDAPTGTTVAVLGSGLNVIYPPHHQDLFARIVEQGVVVTEYPLDTKPEAFRFPARNRIVSGLTLGVVVVEAAKRSGSLITARHALEQGREVFAVPGRVDSAKSEGTHRLLQEGARLIVDARDVLEELAPHLVDAALGTHPLEAQASPGSAELTDMEQRVLAVLDCYPMNIEELILKTTMAPNTLNETLLMLEMKGRVESLPGSRFRATGLTSAG